MRRFRQARGKLGKKSDKGGFYGVPKPGSQTVLYLLNLGTAERIMGDESMVQLQHRGQVLRLKPGSGDKPVLVLGHDYMPDGIGKAVPGRCVK